MSEKTKMWILLAIGCIGAVGGAVIYSMNNAPWTSVGLLGLLLCFVCILLAELVYDDTRAFYTKKMRNWLYTGFVMEVVGLIGLGAGRLLSWGFSDMYLVMYIIFGTVLFVGIIINTGIQVKAEIIHRKQIILNAAHLEAKEAGEQK